MDLKKHIKAFHTRSDGTYGAPRIFKDLMDVGIRVSKKRVARLMREMGICGISRRKSKLDLTRFGGYLISNQKGAPLCHQHVHLIQPS